MISAAFAQGLVVAQVVILALTVVISFASPSRKLAMALSWATTLIALVSIGLAGAVVSGATMEVMGTSSHWITYAGVSFAAAILNWAAFGVIRNWMRVRYERGLDAPEQRLKAGDELRDILRKEGIALDERLRKAEEDREQFLYSLEERHARQIAGLAQEYQHEAQTILKQLLDQLAVDTLRPMVEQRLAEHRNEIESELGAIDSAVAGETLSTLRTEFASLLEQVETAEERIQALQAENPDVPVEEKVAERLKAIDGQIDERMEAVKTQLESVLQGTISDIDVKIADVAKQLDEQVDAASNPLAQRMLETQSQVEAHLEQYLTVLDGRFQETEQILNTRIQDQEQALEGRVLEMESAIESRLMQHTTGVEQVLAEHDGQLQDALASQSEAIGAHFSSERDRLIGELSEHVLKMQEQIASEMLVAEQQARETVEATQHAWNTFTVELEDRFAATRQEALRAAEEVAQGERDRLKQLLDEITAEAQGDINAKVEMLGKEAAWQRAQVERTVHESLDALQTQAREALANADAIFADLEHVGSERVESIRRQAEDALVQSRDYVAQLQDSLGAHLETLRQRSSELADEMNDRLASITTAAHEAASRIETFSREVVESTGRELGTVAESHVTGLQNRITVEFTGNVQRALDEQQRAYEQHLSEIAQRIMQQVQGDLAGLAEHARSAVTSELDQIISQAAGHARQSQEAAFMQVMNELARHQADLGEQTRSATDGTRRMLDESLRESRRQLEEAMASMGAHMREELVRFQDEGQRRVSQIIDGLRGKEQEMIREEDRKLQHARQELLRQHQGQLESQVRNLVGGLSTGAAGGSFTSGVDRPATPLVGGFDLGAPQQPQAPAPGHYPG